MATPRPRAAADGSWDRSIQIQNCRSSTISQKGFLGQVANLDDFGGMLVLDKWVGNADGRQVVFTRKPRGRQYRAMFIDQGYALNACDWDFPDAALRGVYARNCVYKGVSGWESFEPALTKAEEADILDIWRCAEPIPAEWYEFDHDGLERIVESIHQRRAMVRDLISSFRSSSRKSVSKLEGELSAVLISWHGSYFAIGWK